MKPLGETAAAIGRTQDVSSLRRYVAAGRRLLDEKPCDRCGQGAVTETNGTGTGWCEQCSRAQMTERRIAFARLADARWQVARAKARR